MNVDDYNSIIQSLCLDKGDDVLLDLGNNQFQTEVLYQQLADTSGPEPVILVKSKDSNTSPEKIKLNSVINVFRSPPHIIPIDKRNYRLDENYRYKWLRDIYINNEFNKDVKNRINIPEGYIFDGASVPRWLWSISGIRPDGKQRTAALIHDWIYVHKGLLPTGSQEYQDKQGKWKIFQGKWTRKDADKIFAKILKESGMPKSKRRWMYRAVHWFGWTKWWDR